MSQHSELLTRYLHLRQVGLQLNNRLVETLPREVLDEGGKKLGILKKNVLVLGSEDEIAVLMDYCLHDVRRHGVNAIERYLAETPPAADSDEMILLQAQRQARYSVFAVEAIERGVGIHVRDLLRDEPLFVVDVSFSQTAQVDLVFAARVMFPDGIGMTTGTALPIGVVPPAGRARVVQLLSAACKGKDSRHLSAEQASELATAIIRNCLQHGAAEQVRYGEPGSAERLRPGLGTPPLRRSLGSRPLAAPRRVGRNDPCLCGSGKKFKHCCGGRK